MNTTTIYDIFDLAQDLKKANVPQEQIDALIKFEKAKDETITKTLATKEDILAAKNDLKKEIETNGYKTILALVVLIPTVMKILEHCRI